MVSRKKSILPFLKGEITKKLIYLRVKIIKLLSLHISLKANRMSIMKSMAYTYKYRVF